MEKIKPNIDQYWEMREIAEDFTDPLEVFREAISNAYDEGATQIEIEVTKAREGEYKYNPLIIRIRDNGKGLTKEELADFWGLGSSKKRKMKKDEIIGYKGHGTMIYMKSEYIEIQTNNTTNAYRSYCHDPMQSLMDSTLYEPDIEEITPSSDDPSTEIILEGYIDNETSFNKILKFNVIKDYILWFTKHGSIEREFGINTRKDCKVVLKVFEEEETISFGHVFPEENFDLKALQEIHPDNANDYFVKKFSGPIELPNFPNYKCEFLFYYEGREARKEVSSYTGRESDRYGLYLCKDYFPIQRQNEWLTTTFGNGSNGYVRLHCFVNCQDFSLTANRGAVSLKNNDVIEEMAEVVNKKLKEFKDQLDDLRVISIFR